MSAVGPPTPSLMARRRRRSTTADLDGRGRCAMAARLADAQASGVPTPRPATWLRHTLILVVVLAAVAALADAGRAEPPFANSCASTAQEDFDQALALMDKDRLHSRRLFQWMLRYDRECPILYWGVAQTAADNEQRQENLVDALAASFEHMPNAVEWQHISDAVTHMLRDHAIQRSSEGR